ncbi:MAG: hypothetical protein A4E56_02897 [Pelotomaculum sp. PtaU1.Bin065]|nr:MAG: hypothetical protein A4E56_02897 [Pelotomaculum sp. PtaU1.Bin065]
MFKLTDKEIGKTGYTDHKNYWRHVSDCLNINDPEDVEPARLFNESVSVLLKGCRWQEKKALVRLIDAVRNLYINHGWASWYSGREYGQWGELIMPAREGTQICGINVSKELAEALRGVPRKNFNICFIQGDALKDLNILGGHVVIIDTKASPVAGDVAMCIFENGARAINVFLGRALDGTNYAVLPGAIDKIHELEILYANKVAGVVLASVDLAGNVYYKRKNNAGFGQVAVEDIEKVN